MIPTSIDGTDITGATIDGTDVQEITVDGDTVFTSSIASEADSKLFRRWRVEQSGSTLVESVTGDDGTLNGNVSKTSGNFVQGFGLDSPGGSSDFVELSKLGGNFGDFLLSPHAVAFTFKTTSGDASFMGQNYAQGGNYVTWNMGSHLGTLGRSSGQLAFDLQGPTDGVAQTNNEFNDGNFHRVVYNMTGTRMDDLEIYVDQAKESINIQASDGEQADLEVNMYLMASNNNAGVRGPFDVVMDDICIFDDSLTESEIQSYQNPF